MNYQKAPWPYFGGKSKAAPTVWTALGDVEHYVEPFCGSMAVLLNRPHLANRSYHSETVNDADGLLINAWRSIQLHPDATADHASNPVAEADMHARHLALVRWREERQLEHLMGDPTWCDPIMGGWWIWGIACWIGGGWCAGTGPWTADETGRLYKQARSPDREAGVSRQIPYLVSDGQGVNHAGARLPGVSRQLPQLADDGRGVNHAGARLPGITRRKPMLVSDGQGVNRPAARLPGVKRKLPRIADNGQGVNRPGARLPDVDDGEGEWHPVTMPEIVNWFGWLSARLRHVRILNGDWARAVTGGASKTLPVRMGGGHCGVFLDPPYADTAGRDSDLYAHDSLDIAHQVREWCLKNGADRDYRIVLAGFDGEHGQHLEDAGWTTIEWFDPNGYLSGGMGNQNADGNQQHRERLWASPHCLQPAAIEDADGYQPGLFDL